MKYLHDLDCIGTETMSRDRWATCFSHMVGFGAKLQSNRSPSNIEHNCDDVELLMQIGKPFEVEGLTREVYGI